MGISRIEYHELLTSENKTLIKTQTIKSHIPTPTYQDYRQGYIVRYFIQRINDNDALIYEVNETDYLRFSIDEFYNAVNIDWRLTGGEDAIKDSNENLKGVIGFCPQSNNSFIAYFVSHNSNAKISCK